MKKGFTFVEMAIVLMIVGIISGFGTMKLVTSMAHSRYSIEENNKLKKLAGAIVHFAAAAEDNKLPTELYFRNVLAKSYSMDRTFAYKSIGDSPLCSIASTPKKVELCITSDCSQFDNITDVLFVISSAGLNNTLDIDITGNVVRIPTPDRTDDFTKFVTLGEAKTTISCGGGLRIVNDSLPKITADGRNFKDINIVAEQGVPTESGMYWWCVEMVNGGQFFTPTGTSRTRPHLDNTSLSSIIGGCTDPLFIDKKNIQIIQGSQFDQNLKIPSGNYPMTIIAKDKTNTKVQKEVILSVTDLVALPTRDTEEKLVKKYSCVTVDDQNHGNVNICRQNFSDTNKRFCVVTSIDETKILTGTQCADSITKLYTPKTGIK